MHCNAYSTVSGVSVALMCLKCKRQKLMRGLKRFIFAVFVLFSHQNSLILRYFHLSFHLNLLFSSFYPYFILKSLIFVFFIFRAPSKKKNKQKKKEISPFNNMILSQKHAYILNFISFYLFYFHPLAPKRKIPKEKGDLAISR